MSEKRRELLRKVTEIFLDAPAIRSDREAELFDEIVGAVAADLEIQVLIELARKVAISRLARRRTARRLAFDVIEVARPVIEGSCALNFTSRFQWLQSMPVIDGLKAIACIRSSGQGWASVPVIALTADAMSGDRERLIGLGRSGYASKPINRDDLFAEINRVLSLSRPEGLAPASFKPPSSSWIST